MFVSFYNDETLKFGFSYISLMFSYHTHTPFCDGKAPIADFCNKAVELGYRDLAFTSHAPVPFHNNYAITFERLLEYRDEVKAAKVAFEGRLNVYFGLEADFIPGSTIDFDQWRKLLDTDIIVGSVHYVIDPLSGQRWFIDGAPDNFVWGMDNIFKGDWQRAVSAYFAQVRTMVVTQRPNIIGHIDKVKMNNRGVYFDTSQPHYQNELSLTFKTVKESGGIVEINPRGIYRNKCNECFPHVDGIRECMALDVPMTLASDSHLPEELSTGWELSFATAKTAGLETIHVYNGQNWEPILLSSVI